MSSKFRSGSMSFEADNRHEYRRLLAEAERAGRREGGPGYGARDDARRTGCINTPPLSS